MDKACCALAPVSAEYTPKGTYSTIAGLKTYTVQPPNSTSPPARAIIDIYDVFGPAPQTLQGADRLAALTNSVVLVPDWFGGDYCQPGWLGPDAGEEEKAALEAFVGRRVRRLEDTVEKLVEVRRELGKKWPGVEGHVGVFGLCFGGKIAVLATEKKGNEGVGRRFCVSGAAHPARLAAEEHEVLNVPHICLASKDEDAGVVAEVREIVSKPDRKGYVETYETMHHGWMGARADLKNEENLKEFERGYNAVAEFFNKYL